MVIIYNKKTKEVYGRFLRTKEFPEESVIRGYQTESDDFWQGYHISTNPEVYELTPEQEAEWDDTKLYSFDPETNTLTEREKPLDPNDIATRLEGIEAQSTYTAMMTDTLI